MAIINGTPDPDLLLGSAGDDWIESFEGNDTVDGAGGNDTIYGGAGDDLLQGGAGNDVVIGGDGADTIGGGAGLNWLDGEAGDDRFLAAGGTEVYNGGEGTDTVDFSALDGPIAGDIVVGVAGSGFSSVEVLIGTGFGDTIGGSFTGAHVFGAGGDDVLYAVSTADTLDGGAGNDTAVLNNFGTTSITIDLNDGLAATNTVLTTGFENVATGAGSDSITGDGADNTIYAVDGNDTVDGGAGADTVFGGAGDDSLDGGDGNDALVGGTGDDTFHGGAGYNWLDGEGGDDLFVWSGGVDNYIGGSGFDTVDYSHATGPLAGDLVVGIYASGFSSIEKLIGSDFNDSLGGSFTGAYVAGGGGNDDLWAVTAADTLDGGTGTDIAILFDLGTTPVTLDLGDGLAAGNTVKVVDIEHVLSGWGSDSLTGSDAANWIYANGGNDTIDGGAGDDQLYAGDGDDLVSGGAGDDALVGGFGDDTLDGGTGNDWLDGEGGNDLLVYSGGTGTFNGGSGFDTADFSSLSYGIAGDLTLGISGLQIGFSSIEQLIGTNFDDTLGGSLTGASLLAGAGNDVLWALSTSDTLDGGTGEDYAMLQNLGATPIKMDLRDGMSGNNTVKSAGIDNIVSGTGDDSLTGTIFDNAIIGNGGNDTIYGEGGNDYLDGGDGDDLLFGDDLPVGTPGVDTLIGGNGNDTLIALHGEVRGGDGIDLLDLSSAVTGLSIDLGNASSPALDLRIFDVENVSTGSGDDDLAGDALANVLNSGGGDDNVQGGGGDDLILAGAGNDVVFGDDGADIVHGDAGNDTVFGDAGDDTLDGGQGDDFIVGGDGNDLLLGGGGIDTIEGGQGNDTVVLFTGSVDGGDGFDTLDLGSATVGLSIDLANAGSPALDLMITGIEAVRTGSGDDDLSGDDADNLLDSGAGDDVVNGGGGADTVLGGDGNDVVGGGAGDDLIDGGAANDTLDGGDGNDTVLGGAGDDLIDGGAGDDLLIGGTGVDTLSGGAGDDTLVTFAGEVDGGDGFDTLDLSSSTVGFSVNLGNTGSPALDLQLTSIEAVMGGAGDDDLIGDAADNRLDGGAGSDVVDGGDGADTLIGGSGDDMLTGGAGADVFSFAGSFGNDIIVDFAVGEDKLAFAAGSVTAADFVLDGDNLVFDDGVSTIFFVADATGFDFANDVIFV